MVQAVCGGEVEGVIGGGEGMARWMAVEREGGLMGGGIGYW